MIDTRLARTMGSSVTALVLLVSLAACATTRGPSTTTEPYLVPLTRDIEFTAILTAGDRASEYYRMAGIPDGLGAYDNGDGTITVLMNHELGPNDGIVRAHGSKGAFISEWKIRKSDLKVLGGADLINKQVLLVDPAKSAFTRFCSADLPAPSAFFNSKSGKGFRDGRIFMNGEENKNNGRAFAHIASGRLRGTTFELPVFGTAGWENLVASPHEQDKTIVVGLDDGGHNKVFIYIGQKLKQGNPVEQAGLRNGKTYALAIDGYTTDDPEKGFKNGRFSLADDHAKGTVLARPEDGAWDTANPNRFYFVTTASFCGNSRLWRMTFDDIAQPESGGTIEVLLDGAKHGIKMMDNIAVDADGNVYIQEDVGEEWHLGSIWRYHPQSREVKQLARHDPARFDPAVAQPLLTFNEESSGIIDVTHLFAAASGYDTTRFRYFLLTVQAHYNIPDKEVVKGGQLLMMKVKK